MTTTDTSQVALADKARKLKRRTKRPPVPARRAPMRKLATPDGEDNYKNLSADAARPVRLLFKPEVIKLVR